MRKNRRPVFTNVDIASALDSLVSRTMADRNKLKGFAERLFAWSVEAASAHDELIIAQDKGALADQRQQIDDFIASHIDGDESALRATTHVAIDFTAVFWASKTLQAMVERAEKFCNHYDQILIAMRSPRSGYENVDELAVLNYQLRLKAGEAFHALMMSNAALKAFTQMMPTSFSCLKRIRHSFMETRKVITEIEKLRDLHQAVVAGSYRERHKNNSQQRFAI